MSSLVIDNAFLPAIEVAIRLINTTEQNIAYDAGGMLHPKSVAIQLPPNVAV